MSEYTPTTDQVRRAFTWSKEKGIRSVAREGFDSWLVQVKAEAAANALEKFADRTDSTVERDAALSDARHIRRRAGIDE